MEKNEITVFDNIFESEDVAMSHIAMLGKQTKAKTELLTQMIGSLLKSGKKVMWFHPNETNLDLMKKWKPFKLQSKEDLTPNVLKSNSFILLESISVEMEKLKTLLIDSETEWIIIQENLDELVWNYEQNESITQKLDFLYYISEFGRVFNLYTFVIGSNVEKLMNCLLTKKIIENSKNLLLLNQSNETMRYLRKVEWLSDEQLESIKKLKKFEAIHIRK